jgi:hypothetical protein
MQKILRLRDWLRIEVSGLDICRILARVVRLAELEGLGKLPKVPEMSMVDPEPQTWLKRKLYCECKVEWCLPLVIGERQDEDFTTLRSVKNSRHGVQAPLVRRTTSEDIVSL